MLKRCTAQLGLAVIRISMRVLSYISTNTLYTVAEMTTGRPASKARTALGQRIAQARQAAGLTQQQLAKQVKVTQRVIAYWEREAVSLRAAQIDALADTLNVSADTLLRPGKPAPRSGGPTGKARHLFEQVSQLPRARRQLVLRVVEELLKAGCPAATTA